MKDKDFIKKINNLKSIKPDSDWKKINREILLSQVSNSTASLYKNDDKEKIFFILPSRMLQPVGVVFLLTLIVAGSIFSIRVFDHTKPGNSLYIARLVSEKAKIAITFDEAKKARMGIKFSNNRARDIMQILSEYNFESENEQDKNKREKLVNDFKREILATKSKLDEASKNTGSDEEIQVFSANLGKEENGMEFSNGEKVSLKEEEGAGSSTKEDLDIATTTEEIMDKQSVDESKNDLEKAKTKLEEAEELFNDDDYGATLNKLEEVNIILEETDDFENIEKKSIKGSENLINSDQATSTGQ